MNEVIVLGSGTSNGVPSVGLSYSPSFLANPKNHRTRPAILFKASGGNLLVDCPQELRLQLLREDIKMVDGVILTHTHADHVMGMDDIRAFCLLTGRSMPVYTIPRYQDDVRRIFNYAFEETPTGAVPRFDLIDIQPRFETCGLEVESFLVDHGPVPCIGLRVNDFAYLTDVSYIPPAARSKLNGLKILMIDAVRYKPHPNHYHFDAAMEVSLEIGAEMTYFTHLSDNYDHDVTEAGMPPNIRLAYDGLKFEI